MKLFVILLLICATVLVSDTREHTFRKIYGGHKTLIEKHPYQIAVYYKKKLHCGGAILNKYTIVTAAHCIYSKHGDRLDEKSFSIRAGSTFYMKGTEYKVAKVIAPEAFTLQKVDQDIAILKLATPLRYNHKVRPVRLQPKNSPVPEGTKAYVSGWGRVEHPKYRAEKPNRPEKLRGVNMFVLKNTNCQKQFEKIKDQFHHKYNYQVSQNMLCAKNREFGDHNGDSGGPLVAHGRLIGIVSWNLKPYPALPHVYTNISAPAIHNFIVQNM